MALVQVVEAEEAAHLLELSTEVGYSLDGEGERRGGGQEAAHLLELSMEVATAYRGWGGGRGGQRGGAGGVRGCQS